MNLLSAQTRFSPVSLLFVLLIVVGCKTTPINPAQTSPIPPRLVEPLKFVNFTVSQINSLEGISNLMSAKVSIKQDSVLGDYDWESFTGWPGTTNHAETVNDIYLSPPATTIIPRVASRLMLPKSDLHCCFTG